MNSRLTTEKHWEETYINVNFEKIPETSEIYQIIKSKLPKVNKGESSFEIGIYPGTFSGVFGDLGYEINGIDRITDVNISMRKWMLTNNYNVGELICHDFFTYNFTKKYDVVSSFGFIEHFENYEEVIKKHCDLVNKNGYLIIEVPNFRGYVQFLIKKLLDKENLDIHYVKSMNFKKWKKIMEANNFEVLYEDYIGGFSVDFYEQKRNYFQKTIISFIKKYKYFIKKYIFRGKSKHHSPVMMMIAKKN